MARHSFWRIATFIAISATVAYAQVTTTATTASTVTPTQTWTPAATCSNGLPTPASLGGTYNDRYGALWNVECAQDNTGVAYDVKGTNSQGVYACFQGCDKRPGCTAWSFIGSVSGIYNWPTHLLCSTDAYGRADWRVRKLLLQVCSGSILSELDRLRRCKPYQQWHASAAGGLQTVASKFVC